MQGQGEMFLIAAVFLWAVYGGKCTWQMGGIKLCDFQKETQSSHIFGP